MGAHDSLSNGGGRRARKAIGGKGTPRRCGYWGHLEALEGNLEVMGSLGDLKNVVKAVEGCREAKAIAEQDVRCRHGEKQRM